MDAACKIASESLTHKAHGIYIFFCIAFDKQNFLNNKSSVDSISVEPKINRSPCYCFLLKYKFKYNIFSAFQKMFNIFLLNFFS